MHSERNFCGGFYAPRGALGRYAQSVYQWTRVVVSQDGNLVRRLIYNEDKTRGTLSMMTTANQSRDEWWSPSDLLFLKDALWRGMTHAEVAGFLSRGEAEVRKKAKQMKIPDGRSRHYCHYRVRRGV